MNTVKMNTIETNIKNRKTPSGSARFTIISIILLSLCTVPLLSACSDKEKPALALAPFESVIEPGMTTELTLTVVFVDAETAPEYGCIDVTSRASENLRLAPDRKERALFEEEPVITISDPAFKLLSADVFNSKNGIQAKIIVRAGEELLSGSAAEVTAVWGGCSAETVLKIKKNPQMLIDADGVVTDPAAYDVLVNKERRLPADYIPPDLVRIKVPTILVFEEVNHLRQAASDALSAMFAAAEAEKGYELLARSGYRSYKTQVMLYDLNVREYGEDYAKRISAQPGTSEHQSGLAMDISSPVVDYQLVQEFGETDEGIWVAENAHRFGFIIRYPLEKEDITGYTYEPWHLRWVGEQLATEIYSEGLTLEEYFLN